MNSDHPKTPESSRGRRRSALLALLVLGVVTAVIGATTLASFTATTNNPGNVFGNGTVTMTNVAGTVISGSNCSTATNNGTCATLFGSSNAGALKPGGADVANSALITYTGSLTPTGDFRLYAANYTAKLGASSTLCTAPSSGAGNPGTAIDLLVAAGTSLVYPVQNTTLTSALSSGSTYTSLAVNATTAAIASGAQLIVYSAGTYQQVTASAAAASGATSIAVNSFVASAAFGVGSQVAPQGTLDGFASAYTSSANGLQLKGGTNGSGAAGVWATNDNSTFNIKVHLDGTAGNTFQGCQSQSDLVWYASQ